MFLVCAALSLNAMAPLLFEPAELPQNIQVNAYQEAAEQKPEAALPARGRYQRIGEGATKHRLVRLNLGLVQQCTAPGSLIRLNLFPDQDFVGETAGSRLDAQGNATITGKLQGLSGRFVLATAGEAVAMTVHDPDGQLLQLRCVEGDIYELYEVDQSAFPPCSVGPEHKVSKSAVSAAVEASLTAEADAPPQIDVMVVYTPSARQAAGGTNAIRALINAAMADANGTLADSLVNASLRLVHAGEVSYTENGFNVDLNAVTYVDGVMDEVHAWRDTYGADLVSLWINNSASCGLAWQMGSLSTSFASSAFSVLHYNCAISTHSFIHEMGHNMGCAHDRSNAGQSPILEYSYGWRFTGNNGVQYRTVMAYVPGQRIAQFSNPTVLYQGIPTGKANEAANAQSLNVAALTVSSFRNEVAPPPVLTLGEALDNAGFTWTNSGAVEWVAQTNTTHDGIDAAETGDIRDNQYSILAIGLAGPGELSFWWRVSSEKDYDLLDVSMDGNPVTWISGAKDWSRVSLTIPAGAHVVAWKYGKDAAGGWGEDRGWLDQVVYRTAPGMVTHRVNGQNSEVSFSTTRGASYTVQTSSDLRSWQTATNVISATNGVMMIVEPRDMSPSARFYRVQSP